MLDTEHIMKHKKTITIIAFLLLGLGGLHAQESPTATGGEATGTSGTASYTVGQTVYTTSVGTNGNTVAQGVQQPYEISVVTGIVEKGISLTVSAYPNPTTDYLILKIDASTSLGSQLLEYQVFDTNGKLLQIIKATGNETHIETSNLVPTTYYLRVVKNNQVIKTFKILKH